jgi:hypothetical protein
MRHLAGDRTGLPLLTLLSGANVPDGTMLLHGIDALPKVQGMRGRPRFRPEKVHADKARNDKKHIAGRRERGIVPRIARKAAESNKMQGRFRWAVKRTFSWQQGARRLRFLGERRDDIYEAFVQLENALICWGRLNGCFC